MRRVIHLFVICLLGWSIGTGCASHSKTVRTETVEYPVGTVRHTGPVVVERQTTTTTETEGGSSGGVLSGTVNLVGEILALPFRLIGGLFSLIF